MMKDIHNRMPVILNKTDEQAWLFEKDEKYLSQLLRPFDPAKMQAYQISSKINSPENNFAQVIERDENIQGSLGF
jgi:putative SOS response-associated peptidase YedK